MQDEDEDEDEDAKVFLNLQTFCTTTVQNKNILIVLPLPTYGLHLLLQLCFFSIAGACFRFAAGAGEMYCLTTKVCTIPANEEGIQ